MNIEAGLLWRDKGHLELGKAEENGVMLVISIQHRQMWQLIGLMGIRSPCCIDFPVQDRIGRWGGYVMQLEALQTIVEGTVSLAELEKAHPILGRNFKNFVTTVNRCCQDAYERFSICLNDVLTLSTRSGKWAKSSVIKKL